MVLSNSSGPITGISTSNGISTAEKLGGLFRSGYSTNTRAVRKLVIPRAKMLSTVPPMI